MKIKSNPFCSSLRIAAQCLTLDNTLKMTWKTLPPGMGAGYDRWTNEIILPAINTCEISENEAKELNALCYHERLHHFLTTDDLIINALKLDNKNIEEDIEKYLQNLRTYQKKSDGNIPVGPKNMKRGIYTTLTNYIEDCRIELNEHCRFDGDLEDLLWYRKENAGKRFEEEFELLLTMNPWGTIMQTMQYNVCKYKYFLIDKDKFPEQHKMYNIAWEIINDGRFKKSCSLQTEGSNTSLILAKEIIEKWKTESNKNVSEEFNKDNEEPNSEKELLPVEGNENEQNPSKMIDGENQLFNNKNERNIEEEFNNDQEKDNGRYNINPDELNHKVAEIPNKQEKQKEEIVPQKTKNNKTNPNMSEVFKTPYIAYNTSDRFCYPKNFPENYSQIKTTISHKIKQVTKELSKILVSESQFKTHKFLKKGKIDRRRLHAIIKNDERIFKKITPGYKQEAAVQLIIDLSGSMSGQKATLAVQVACLFAEVLNSINMPFEVIGFNTSAISNEEYEIARKNGFTRFDVINHWIFKEFNENWSQAHSRLGACCNGMPISLENNSTNVKKNILKDIDGCIGGANCDHETILLGAARLYQQPQKRKIQIVISDGIPSGHYGDYGGQLQEMLIKVNNKIINAGIEQVAFGIMCSGVKNFYSKSYTIKNLNELSSKAIQYLSNKLLNHTMKNPNRWDT